MLAPRRVDVPLHGLDRLFAAIDAGWAGAGLPGADIHLLVECSGPLDLAGLQASLDALTERFPVLGARLTRGGPTGIGWRLAGQGPRITERGGAARGAGEIRAEDLNSRIDWSAASPLQAEVVRGGGASGDALRLRWPHCLMDVRGAGLLIEHWAELYRCLTPAAAPAASNPGKSLGDERRLEFGGLNVPTGRLACLRLALRRSPAGPAVGGPVVRWPFPDGPPGELRMAARTLAPPAAARASENAVRVCGPARLGDFLRACGLAALHARLGAPPRGAGYTTVELVDHRRRRTCGPVLRNVFSALPLWIPAEVADDRAAIAEAHRAQLAAAFAADFFRRRQARQRLLELAPFGWLAGRFQRALQSEASRRRLPIGLLNAPSLPLGVTPVFDSPLVEFGGARIVNVLGGRPSPPQAGFALNVGPTHGVINLNLVYWSGRLSTAEAEGLLDAYQAALLT